MGPGKRAEANGEIIVCINIQCLKLSYPKPSFSDHTIVNSCNLHRSTSNELRRNRASGDIIEQLFAAIRDEG